MSDPDEPVEGEWLWDRRTNKAYCPVAVEEDRVVMATAWHREEVADAREAGALVPVEEIRLDRTDTTFDLLDSFRLLDDDELAALGAGEGDE